MNEEYQLSITYEQSRARAVELGQTIVLPEQNQLSDEDYERFCKTEYIISKNEPRLIEFYERHPSKSGGRKQHITVRLGRAVSNLERIALQAVLGSDRSREALSLLSHFAGHPHPTMFFENT